MSALLSRTRPTVQVTAIRPADLELPVTLPIDVSYLISAAATNEGTG